MNRRTTDRISLWLLGVLACAGVLPATALQAQEPPPMATDRPDQTEGATVVGRGFYQLEAGGLHVFDREGSGPAMRLSNLGGALLRIGVLDPVEVRLGFAGWQRASTEGGTAVSGFGDPAVGLKVRLARGSGLSPAVSLLTNVVLPVGTPDFRAAGWDPSVRLAVAHDLGSGLGLGYNVGMALRYVPDGMGGEDVESYATYTLVLGRQLLPKLAAFVEAFGESRLSGTGSSWLALDGGFTVPVRANLQFDASAGLGLSEGAANWFVSAGLAVRGPR